MESYHLPNPLLKLKMRKAPNRTATRALLYGKLVNLKPNKAPIIEYGALRNTKTKQRDFLGEVVKNNGLIYKSCSNSGIRYSTYRTWLKDDHFKTKLEEAQQQVNEQVEQSLISKFNGRSPIPEMFYLKSRDKRYNQTNVILEGNEDKPIIITHDSKTLEKIGRSIIEAIKNE